MRAIIYSALLGLAGGACLVAVHIVSHIEGSATDPHTYRWLVAGCWFGLAAGVGGAVGGVVGRGRHASRSLTTLIISVCIGVALLAVWTRVASLPSYIRDREPMRPNPAAALDGGPPVLFAFLAHWPAASEPQCS